MSYCDKLRQIAVTSYDRALRHRIATDYDMARDKLATPVCRIECGAGREGDDRHSSGGPIGSQTHTVVLCARDVRGLVPGRLELRLAAASLHS